MNVKTQTRKLKNGGFTILEVMIAGAVLAIGCLGILAMLLTAQENNATSNSRNMAVYVGDNLVNAIENEMRSLTVTNTPGDNCHPTVTMSSSSSSASSDKEDLISIILKDSASATGGSNKWSNFGPVTEIGRKWKSDMASTSGGHEGETAHFCVGIYARAANCRMYSGAIRIYWRKNNRAATGASNTCDVPYASFDTISGAKSANAKDFEFITIPYSFVLNDERRY